MKPIKIEFCNTNMQNGSAEVYRRLKEEFPGLGVREYGCLGNCDACAAGPYCVVGGVHVHGRDAAELWEKVLAEIRRQGG